MPMKRKVNSQPTKSRTGNAFRNLRLKYRMTQGEVAEYFETDTGTISRLEHGHRNTDRWVEKHRADLIALFGEVPTA